MSGRLTRWQQIDRGEKIALVVAVARLLDAYIGFRLRPTEAILDDLTKPAAVVTGPQDRRDPDAPRRIGWAIGLASRIVPWRADCLVQAMAASAWLRKLGYAPQFRLGLLPADRDQTDLVAHAWLELDGKVIVGGEDAGEQYVSIMRAGDRGTPDA